MNVFFIFRYLFWQYSFSKILCLLIFFIYLFFDNHLKMRSMKPYQFLFPINFHWFRCCKTEESGIKKVFSLTMKKQKIQTSFAKKWILQNQWRHKLNFQKTFVNFKINIKNKAIKTFNKKKLTEKRIPKNDAFKMHRNKWRIGFWRVFLAENN